jgi:cell division protein FtsB
MNPVRWLGLAVFLAAVAFALLGGEYSTLDLITLTRQAREEALKVAELQRTVDSLAVAARALERDPRVQERVARESFGMIRQGEFLYKLVPPDSTGDR